MHTVGSNTKGILRKEETIQGVKEEVVQGKGSAEGNQFAEIQLPTASYSFCLWVVVVEGV